MKQQAKDRPSNGGPRLLADCPVGDCKMQAEVMKSIDAFSLQLEKVQESVGLLLQRIEQVNTESLDRARNYIECNDQILLALRRVEEQIKGEADAA